MTSESRWGTLLAPLWGVIPDEGSRCERAKRQDRAD